MIEQKLFIKRIYQHDCTIGVLNAPDENFRCMTLELPDRANQTDISCIPAGTYIVEKYTSPNHGQCFKVLNVINRSNILIHKGNFTRDTKGCILVGSSLTDLDKDGTIDVTNSMNTLEELLSIMPPKFLVTID